MKRFVFGLGTGRCGTYTLYRLLEAQKNFFSTHELGALTWSSTSPVESDKLLQMWRFLYKLESNAPTVKYISNSALYWISYTSEIMSYLVNPRMICLYRDRQTIIESYMAYMPNVNHWTSHDSRHWDDNKWSRLNRSEQWPSYDLPIDEAIGRYWDEYMGRAEFWANKFPEAFMLIETGEAFNSQCGQKRIFDFIGIPEEDRVYHVGLRLNTRTKPKGAIGDGVS